jgi:hypothetical protein
MAPNHGAMMRTLSVDTVFWIQGGLKMKKLIGVVVVFFFLVSSTIMVGCGGGSSGGSAPAASPSQTGSTVSGVASKGLIAGGNVIVYEIDDSGNKVLPALATGTTESDGSYALSIVYTGPVLVEITSGEYVDEASGLTTPITQPLRAALPSVNGDVQVAVTPLTELAVRLADAGGGLLPGKIAAANQLLSQLLGPGGDIIGTVPANPNSATDFSGASAEGQNYALLLAAISQIAYSSGYDVMDIVKSIEEDIQDLEMDFTGPALVDALAEFLDNNNSHNNTGADASDAGPLTSTLNSIIADGLTPTGSLTEAKELLAQFLQDPSQANYDTLMAYLTAFTPASQEAHLFKGIASLLNIYQSAAAGFITSGQDGLNLSTNFDTFDANQFMDGLLHSAAIHEDIIDLFAEIADRLDETYSNLEQAEGVNTFISLAGFDTVYLDDVDVKILQTMTRAWQSVFTLAQAVNLEVTEWSVASGTGTVDVRDLIAGDQALSQAQHDEFMANNPDLFKYADTDKLPEFRAAFAQAAAELTQVVNALNALGASGREARRQNAFNIDSDRDFVRLKAISERTMTSLVEATNNPATVIVTPTEEETGGSLVLADDGYTYMQTEHNIYLTPHTPVSGLITLYDLANGIQSLRDLYAAASATEDYEPYQEGNRSLYQGNILEIEWDWPIESVDINAAYIVIDGDATDWAAVPVAQSISGFTIKMAAGASGQDYCVYISNPPVTIGAGGSYYFDMGRYWPWWPKVPTAEDYFSATVSLTNSGSASVWGSEYGQDAPTNLPVAESDKALILNNGSVVGVEIKFSRLDRLAVSDFVNYLYFSWDLNGSSGYRSNSIKLYP